MVTEGPHVVHVGCEEQIDQAPTRRQLPAPFASRENAKQGSVNHVQANAPHDAQPNEQGSQLLL